MEFSDNFRKKLVEKIDSIISDESIIDDIDRVIYLGSLMNIYNAMFNIETQKQQLKLFKECQNNVSKIDFSKFDISDILKSIGK